MPQNTSGFPTTTITANEVITCIDAIDYDLFENHSVIMTYRYTSGSGTKYMYGSMNLTMKPHIASE